MQTLRDIQLSNSQVKFIAKAINTYGGSAHPYADPSTIRGFAKTYALACVEKTLFKDHLTASERRTRDALLAKLAPAPRVDWNVAIRLSRSSSKRGIGKTMKINHYVWLPTCGKFKEALYVTIDPWGWYKRGTKTLKRERVTGGWAEPVEVTDRAYHAHHEALEEKCGHCTYHYVP